MDAPLAKGGLQHALAQPGPSNSVLSISLQQQVLRPFQDGFCPGFPHIEPCLSSLFLLLACTEQGICPPARIF